jgi:hypothetical protein
VREAHFLRKESAGILRDFAFAGRENDRLLLARMGEQSFSLLQATQSTAGCDCVCFGFRTPATRVSVIFRFFALFFCDYLPG